MPREAPTGPQRELAVDLYRVVAVALIVAGHWLAASVTYRHGGFVRENPLEELPWTQWLTWIFQVVPVFFLVAGYAGAASWTRRTTPVFDDWLRRRFRGVLGPTTAYVAVVLAVVGAALLAGVDRSSIDLSGWAVAMHLWFIPMYLAVVALTPLAVAMHRRWGLLAPAALCVAVAVVDAVSVSGLLPALGIANNLLCWLALFQLGVAWFFGSVRGRGAVGLAVTAGLLVSVVLAVGPYPVSLIGVPGQVVQNSAPPSVVLLLVGLVQSGLLIAIAPTVTRWLRGSFVEGPLAAANRRVMLVYLWHMLAVVVLAVVAYPAGLFPPPPMGTGAWWLSRLLWIAVLSALTALVLAVVGFGRTVLAADLVSVPVRMPESMAVPLLLVGAGIAGTVLWEFSSLGFAPGGRFPVGMALVFAAGIAVAALRPSAPPEGTVGADSGSLVRSPRVASRPRLSSCPRRRRRSSTMNCAVWSRRCAVAFPDILVARSSASWPTSTGSWPPTPRSPRI